MSRQLETLLDNRAGAEPLARTLMALAQSAAAIAGYLKNGVRHIEWSSAKNDNACHGCQANAAIGATLAAAANAVLDAVSKLHEGGGRTRSELNTCTGSAGWHRLCLVRS